MEFAAPTPMTFMGQMVRLAPALAKGDDINDVVALSLHCRPPSAQFLWPHGGVPSIKQSRSVIARILAS